MASHWTFSDGATADARTITVRQKHLGGFVTITDGAGNTVMTSVHLN